MDSDGWSNNSHYIVTISWWLMMIDDDWRLMVTIQRAEIHGDEISHMFSACRSHPHLDPSTEPRVFRDEFDAQPFQLACEDPIPAGAAALWKTRMESYGLTVANLPWTAMSHPQFSPSVYELDILVYPLFGMQFYGSIQAFSWIACRLQGLYQARLPAGPWFWYDLITRVTFALKPNDAILLSHIGFVDLRGRA